MKKGKETKSNFLRFIYSFLFGILSRFSGFPDSSVGKESAFNTGNPNLILGHEDPMEKG